MNRTKRNSHPSTHILQESKSYLRNLDRICNKNIIERVLSTKIFSAVLVALWVIYVTEKRKKQITQQNKEKGNKGIQWKQKNHLYPKYVFVCVDFC